MTLQRIVPHIMRKSSQSEFQTLLNQVTLAREQANACGLLPTDWGTLLSVSVSTVRIRRNSAWHFFCLFARRLQKDARM